MAQSDKEACIPSTSAGIIGKIGDLHHNLSLAIISVATCTLKAHYEIDMA